MSGRGCVWAELEMYWDWTRPCISVWVKSISFSSGQAGQSRVSGGATNRWGKNTIAMNTSMTTPYQYNMNVSSYPQSFIVLKDTLN